MKGNYNKENPQFINIKKLVDIDNPKQTKSENLELVLIRLDKLSDSEYNEREFIRWLKIIVAKSYEEMKKEGGNNKMFKYVIRKFRDFTMHPRFRRLPEYSKENYLEAKKIGMKEGVKRGMERGIEKGKFEVAKNMMKDNFDLNTISNVTGLSLREIEKL